MIVGERAISASFLYYSQGWYRWWDWDGIYFCGERRGHTEMPHVTFEFININIIQTFDWFETSTEMVSNQ